MPDNDIIREARECIANRVAKINRNQRWDANDEWCLDHDVRHLEFMIEIFRKDAET
ncbi:hypothetical protein [Streptomyces sp. WZ-12]|uniref:hypothetical protein n=1 Tax=Streptomyces sp. WZ-12 TaxID=3030210 RepID=UPI0023811405|nr:hypothetical protein [Streptomyces sp. WZ-12]